MTVKYPMSEDCDTRALRVDAYSGPRSYRERGRVDEDEICRRGAEAQHVAITAVAWLESRGLATRYNPVL